MDKLSIRLKIVDREYVLKTPPDEEFFLREAGKLIQERIRHHREAGVRDTQDVMALVALECVVARLKGDDNAQRFLNMVDDRATQLDKVISPSIL